MSRLIVERKIYLPPRFLNENVLQNLQKEINAQLLGKCEQEHGYILKIYNNIHVLSNTISTTGAGVYFVVRFAIKTLKPEKGQDYEGKVVTIFDMGMIIDVQGKMKMLVPAEMMLGYKLTENGTAYTKKGLPPIRVGETVTVKVIQIEYTRQQFNCIASLKKGPEK